MIIDMQIIENTAGLVNVAELAATLKALGDETRLNLLLKISREESVDGACICDLTPATNLAQSTVSHHMKILVDAGILNRRQKGKWAHFSLTPKAVALLDSLQIESLNNADCC
jgi:ArsR family transcriptional regulator